MKRFGLLVAVFAIVIIATSFATTRLPRPHNEDEQRLLEYAKESGRIKFMITIDTKCKVSQEGHQYPLAEILPNVVVSNFELIHVRANVNGKAEWLLIDYKTALSCPK